MSGGRATVRGIDVRQCGDITAVAPEGHVLTDRWFVETKHVRDLNLWGLLHGKGNLKKFWEKAYADAHRWGKKPLLIAKQNQCPVLMCLPYKEYDEVPPLTATAWNMDIYLFEEVLKHKFHPF